MKMNPTLKNDFNLFDDVLTPVFGRNQLMRTDITEKDGRYYFKVDLPGFHKDDIKVSLEDGNLVISAEHHDNDSEKDHKGNVIKEERYEGSCSRSFYVGSSITNEDVHASFNNGTLEIDVPTEKTKQEESRKYITIE